MPRRLQQVADLDEVNDRVISLARLREAGVSATTRRSHVRAERWRAIPY